MSIISMGMVAVSLMVFGIFFVILVNINANVNSIKKDYQIQVYCDPSLSFNDPLVNDIENQIKNNPNVESYKKISKEQAFEILKYDMLKDDASVLDNMSNDFLPISFTVKLKDLSIGTQTGNEFESISNVTKVNYPQKEMEVINTMASWVYTSSLLIGGILALAAMFIISNTIRLTVFARKRDINIMKYVGASDSFVRLPFLIEGIVMGILGSIISFLIVGYSYMSIIGTINIKLVSMGIVSVKLLDFTEIAPFMFLCMLGIGAVVGIVGSAISVRKHLKV
jgi:cell division transport system permease protein